MTCNNIDKIQPALLRPGRIDLKLKLDYAAPEQIRDTFWRFMDLDDETSEPLEGEERKTVEKLAVEFEKMIPDYHVTTAEIQSYFIDMLLESKANDWKKEMLYEQMFTRVPDFLGRVELDRKQSKNHSGVSDKEDENKKEKNKDAEEEKKQGAEEEKKESAEEEKKEVVEEAMKKNAKEEEKKDTTLEEKKEVSE